MKKILEKGLQLRRGRVAKAIKDVNNHCLELKKELHKEYYPKIEPGFKTVLERLSHVKHLYAGILRILEEIKDDYPDEHKANIEQKITLAKNAYIATDQAMETVKGIQQALRLAPTRFFD